MATLRAENPIAYKGEGEKLASSIAMIVVLVSFSMLFASLFLAYFYYRVTEPVWPPMGMENINLMFPSISTAIIILSSLTLFGFDRAFKKEDQANMKVWLGLTVLLGMSFLASQMYLWDGLKNIGLYASSGIFPSIVYSFTWIHVAHIVAAIVSLFWLVPITTKAKTTFKEENVVLNVSKFWHFLSIIWLIIYFSIFVF